MVARTREDVGPGLKMEFIKSTMKDTILAQGKGLEAIELGYGDGVYVEFYVSFGRRLERG